MVSARTCSRPSYACAPQSQRPTRHRTRLRLLPVNDAATECALACGGHAACVSQFLRFVAVDYSATVDPVRRIVYAELAIEAQDVGLPRCALGRGGPDCKAYVTTSISSSFVVLPPTWPSGRVFDYVSRAPGPPLALCRTEHCVLSALRPHACCAQVPPNPTLIPPLPTDIFFPFEFQDTTAGTTFAARRRPSRAASAKIHSPPRPPARALSPPASSWLPCSSHWPTRGAAA